VHDRYTAGEIEKDEASVRNLTGRGLPGNRGLLDLGLFKFDIRDELLDVELESLPGVSKEDKEIVKSKLKSHADYRLYWGFPTDLDPPPQPWLGMLSNPLKSFVKLTSEAVYTRLHDGILKAGQCGGKTAAESIRDGNLGDLLANLKDELIQAADARVPADGDGAENKEGESSDSKPFSIAMGISSANQQPNARVFMKINALSDDERDALRMFEKEALAIISQGVELLAEKPSAAQMAEAMRNTAFGKIKGVPGDQGQYAIAMYAPRLAAESTTQPALRVPPLRNTSGPGGGPPHYRKMVQSVLMMRYETGDDHAGNAIDPGDVFIISDSGRHGNVSPILSAFVDMAGTALQRCHAVLYAAYGEGDVEKRRDVVRGSLSVSQTENFNYISLEGIRTLKHPRVHQENSTTAGTALHNLPMPDLSDKLSVFEQPIYKGKSKVWTILRIPNPLIENDSCAWTPNIVQFLKCMIGAAWDNGKQYLCVRKNDIPFFTDT
jgi:hypothetical protein